MSQSPGFLKEDTANREESYHIHLRTSTGQASRESKRDLHAFFCLEGNFGIKTPKILQTIFLNCRILKEKHPESFLG
ncbi:hypothetical protein J6590_077092 [Homalodisca vitripennis]|nr:hypothetical protein J6590_077092 [Homalodisca vitripennis]